MIRWLGHLEAVVREEVDYVADLDDYVWHAVGEALQCPARDLQSGAIAAAKVSQAFIDNKVFRVARTLPWSLAVGDIDANIDDLARGPEPTNITAGKIWRLAKARFNRSRLIEGISKFRDASWSTTTTEQGHGSASTIKKQHSDLGRNMLMQRSMSHSLRQLFSVSQDEKKGIALQAKLKALRAKKPGQVRAKNMFLQDCVATAKALTPSSSKMGEHTRQQFFRSHSGEFASLSSDQQEHYRRRASDHADAKRHKLNDDIAHANAELQLAQTRMAEESKLDLGPLRMSACRFSAENVAHMKMLYESEEMAFTKVQQLRVAAQAAPSVPSPAERLRLTSMAVPEQPSPKAPYWLSPLAWNRSSFSQCALAFTTSAGERSWFAFLFATQSQFFAAFAPLQPIESPPVPVFTCANWEEQLLEVFEWNFRCQGPIVYSDGMRFEDSASLHVLPRLSFGRQSLVVSASDLVPWAEFLPPALMRKAHAKAATKTAEADSDKFDHNEAVLASHPWLADFVGNKPVGKKGEASKKNAKSWEPDAWPTEHMMQAKKKTHEEAEDKSETESSDDELSDDQVEKTFALLRAKRAEWAEQFAQEAVTAFTTTLLGGAWLMKYKGIEYDAFQGKASAGLASEWCLLYGLNKTARFDLSMYSEHGAGIMARAWCHRMEYYFSIWVEAAEGYAYTNDDHEAYTEPNDFEAFAADAQGRVLQRVEQVRAILPGNCVSA